MMWFCTTDEGFCLPRARIRITCTGEARSCSVPNSIDLLHGGPPGPGARRRTAEAATRHTTLRRTPGCLVHLHHDGIDHALEILLLRLELILLRHLVLVEPVKGILHRLLDLLLVARFELVLQLLLLERVAHGEAIILQAILGLDLRLVLLVLILVLLGLLHHTIDLRLRQAALFVRDGDLLL